MNRESCDTVKVAEKSSTILPDVTYLILEITKWVSLPLNDEIRAPESQTTQHCHPDITLAVNISANRYDIDIYTKHYISHLN